jgi:hypothetical protein
VLGELVGGGVVVRKVREKIVEEETTWRMPWGVEKNTQNKAGEDENMAGGGIVDLEGRMKEGVGEDAKSIEEGSKKENEGMKLASGEHERTSVVKKVLLRNTCREGNKLIHMLKEVEEKRVESLGGPVNGDCVAVFEKDNMLSRKIRDTDFWLPGKTTTMAIGVEGVRVRHWKCGGGKVCRNAQCFYLQRTKNQNNSSFIRRGGDSWVCFYCKKEAAPLVTLGPCEAQKWTITDDREVAHCHKGEHNHPLGSVEDQGREDKWHLEVMANVTIDPSMTPAQLRHRFVVAKLVEMMAKGDKDMER